MSSSLIRPLPLLGIDSPNEQLRKSLESSDGRCVRDEVRFGFAAQPLTRWPGGGASHQRNQCMPRPKAESRDSAVSGELCAGLGYDTVLEAFFIHQVRQLFGSIRTSLRIHFFEIACPFLRQDSAHAARPLQFSITQHVKIRHT